MAKTLAAPTQEQPPVEAIGQMLKAELPLEEWPLETLRDYRRYNEEARKRNKQARKLLYTIKQCPVELHPHQRIRLSNNDQTNNLIPVHLSNEFIHYDAKLRPGNVYDLPEIIVDHLTKRGYPIWDYQTQPNGARETIKVGQKPRFSVTTVWQPDQWA